MKKFLGRGFEFFMSKCRAKSTGELRDFRERIIAIVLEDV